jgi:hypothetical protein
MICHLEIHCERKPIHGMAEQEFIGPVSLRDTQIRRQAAPMRKLDHLTPRLFGSFFWQKGLILNQSPAPERSLPAGNIIQQEVKFCV